MGDTLQVELYAEEVEQLVGAQISLEYNSLYVQQPIIEMGEMLKYWEEFGNKSWSGEKLITKEDLGIEFPFVTIKQAFGTFDWEL